MREIERAELAKELDVELDHFIEGLAKQSAETVSKKPFNYDEWCKEIDQHPAFMTEIKPDKNGEFSEGVQALQALKYEDRNMLGRKANAEQHKIDGNRHFKFMKYKWAIVRYTDGINQKCADRSLNSVLYANRAAAHKQIGNLNAAFKDCCCARKFDPENAKAIIRGAECLIELGRGKQCLDWLRTSDDYFDTKESIPPYKGSNTGIERFNNLYKKALQLSTVEERNERKKRLEATKDLDEKRILLSAFAERNIKFRPELPLHDPQSFEWSMIEVDLPWLKNREKVYLDDCGVMHWPLLAQYPELGKIDLITNCSEESSVDEVFRSVFQRNALADVSNLTFSSDNVRYFVTVRMDKNYDCAEFDSSVKIGDLFSIRGFFVEQGLPSIQIYTKKHAGINFVHMEDCYYKVK
ncbi:unnamed protein product [Thelazia callipaeda]|uniref:Wheel domain-containing protein n=1 Tax=Thelazia callipaeda TaxID=103827 RepID=A0A0N5D9L1_THECL|nr:unnamed protein product [Thelazia callipaeda]